METEFARQQMVEQQVRAWDVLSSRTFLKALNDSAARTICARPATRLWHLPTPRSRSVMAQKMMTPTLEGRAAAGARSQLQPTSVLEIGTGTGFLAACLAQPCRTKVTSVEVLRGFSGKTPAANLEDSGARDNVELLAMDATQELPDEQFDVIAITGSLQSFDPRFVDAFNPGGRLFVVVGDQSRYGCAPGHPDRRQ